MIVLHAGFSVGATVIPEGAGARNAHFRGHLSKIKFVASDGAVTLIPLDRDGAEKTSHLVIHSMDKFLSEFNKYSGKLEVDVRSEYKGSSDFKVEVFKSVLITALDIASHQDSSQCTVQLEPTKMVLANADMLADKLIIVPATPS